jgi:hypothetical protein
MASVPLILFVALIYLGVSVSEYYAGRTGMSVVFIGYALSNIGFILALLK